MRAWFASLPLARKVVTIQLCAVFCLLVLVASSWLALGEQTRTSKMMYEKQVLGFVDLLRLQRTLERIPASTSKIIVWVAGQYDQSNIDKGIQKIKDDLKSTNEELARMVVASDTTSEEGELLHAIADSMQVFSKVATSAADLAPVDIQLASFSLNGAEQKFHGVTEKLDSLIRLRQAQAKESYDRSEKSASNQKFRLAMLALVTLLLTGLLILAIFRTVVKPVNALARTLSEMTRGQWDLTRRMEVRSFDEVGHLSSGINAFIERLQGIVADLGQKTVALSESSRRFSEVSTRLQDETLRVKSQSTSAQSSTLDISRTVSTVASAASGMSDSVAAVGISIQRINESLAAISSNCRQDLSVSTSANEQASNSRAIMARLDTSAQAISKIVGVIKDISNQSHLLALNATIEAARAGEAGKGFGVVATEVKLLAQKTATATEDIRVQIDTMLSDVRDSVASMDSITAVVREMADHSRDTSTSVEEQTATVGEIAERFGSVANSATGMARDVDRSAKVLASVTEDVRTVTESAEKSLAISHGIREDSSKLAIMSEDLRSVVDQFKV